MLRTYRITYDTNSATEVHVTTITAASKYDAKRRFYRKYPESTIKKIEEVYRDEKN